jgi:hypothetical protein
MAIQDMQYLLCGECYAPGSSEDRIFWANWDNTIEVPFGSTLKREVLKIHRKSLEDWKSGKKLDI